MSNDDLLPDWDPGDPITPEVVEAWRTQKRQHLEQKIDRLRQELAEAEQELADMERDQESSLSIDEAEPLDEDQQVEGDEPSDEDEDEDGDEPSDEDEDEENVG